MSHSAPQRFPLLAAGFFGLTGVALGALGAHKLEPLLDQRGMMRAWETGSRYHLMHAVALLALAAVFQNSSAAMAGRLVWAARCWSAGILLFSGSLYWLALVGPSPRAIVYATPLGGIALLAGWALVFAAAFAKAGPIDGNSSGR